MDGSFGARRTWVRFSQAAPSDPSVGAGLTGGWPAHRPPPGGRTWQLFLSRDGAAARSAAVRASACSGGVSFAPPDVEDLPLTLHEFGPLPEEAACLVLLDFHRAFPCRASLPGRPAGDTPPVPVLATPAYVLARLTRLGAGRRELIASAREDEMVLRAPDLLAGRGAACQFTVSREPSSPPGRAAVSGPGFGSDPENLAAADPAALRRFALHAPRTAVRAEAAETAAAADDANAVGHLLAGCSLAERKRPAEAASAFRRAVERDGELAAAHFELGKTMIVLDDLEAALASFRRTTETLPAFALGWANAGAALGELERPAEALVDLEKAADIDPLSHSLASNLGVTLRDLGRLGEAEAAFRRALGLAPDFVFGHYNLANVVYLQGRHREAVELFEKARAMDPSGSHRQRLLLAAARLAAGDETGALRDYSEVFASLEGQMRLDMRTVAQWDLRRLAERVGLNPGIRRAAGLVGAVRA